MPIVSRNLALTEFCFQDQAGNDNVVIAEVDCTVESSICGENGVKGYPTLKAFKGGKEIEKYAGGRDMASFKKALSKYLGSAGLVDDMYEN